MGKDLHYSILPFITKAFDNHNAIKSYKLVPDNDFYIFEIKRKFGYKNLFVVLSDDYSLGDYAIITRHSILKDGGFILVARPEAFDNTENDSFTRLGIGKIGKLLGALNKDDFWDYEIPDKKN